MHTIVEIRQDHPSICLEVTYFFYKRASNDSIILRIEKISNQNKSRKETLYLQKKFDFHWVKERRETDLPGAGKYNISISITPHAVFIGDISFCKKGEQFLIILRKCC
jgi:hypothetical protein